MQEKRLAEEKARAAAAAEESAVPAAVPVENSGAVLADPGTSVNNNE